MYKDLEIEHKIQEEDRAFIDRMKSQFLNNVSNSHKSSPNKELI